MEYTIIERVIEEDISAEYQIAGTTYQANITPHGRGGMAEYFSKRNRIAIVEIEGVGEVRVTFPPETMLQKRDFGEHLRFTEYAEKQLEKAAELLVIITDLVAKKGYTLTRLELSAN